MSDYIFPIISTTPPPLDFDDEEDDFTDFATAQNHWTTETSEDFTDCPLPEVKDSPLDSPVKTVHLKNRKDIFKNACLDETVPSPVPNNDEDEIPSTFVHNHTSVTSPPNHVNKPVPNSAINKNIPPLEQSDFTNLNSLKGSYHESIVVDNKPNANIDSLTQKDEVEQTNGVEANVSDTLNECQSSSDSEYEELQPSFKSSPEQTDLTVKETNNWNKSSDEITLEHCTTDQNDENDSHLVKTDSSSTELSEKFYSSNDLLEVAMKDADTAETDKTDNTAEMKPINTSDEESQSVLPCAANEIPEDSSSKNCMKAESIQENDGSVMFKQNSESDGEDDFADFASFDVSSSTATANKGTTVDPDENAFATFSSPQSIECTVQNSDNPTREFTAFENQEFPSASEAPSENGGFAEFSASAFSQSAATTFEAFNSTQKDEDSDFDDFENFQTNTTQSNNADDDFGDFSTSTKPDTSTFQQTSFQALHEHPSVDFGKWFSFSTPGIIENEIPPIYHQVEDDLLEIFSSESIMHNTESGQKLSHRASYLWDLLEDIDNAIALRFIWNNSSHHQHLLASLGIKTQNILFGRTSKPYYVPNYYAAGLGMLEPGKEIIKPMSAAEKITAISPKEKNMPVDEKAWSVETEPNGVVNGAHACSEGHQSVGAIANGNTATGIIDASSLNLDMLNSIVKSQNSATSKSEQDKIDPELLELAMEVTPDQASTKKADPLSKILATLGVSSTSKKSQDSDEDLSEEAKKVLKKLPELSFMRSKVLMFPVGQSSTIHH